MHLRVVGDTNFWMAVVGWTGLAHHLYLALRQGQFIHLTSTKILAEITHALRYLPGLTDEAIYEWYGILTSYSELVSVPNPSIEVLNVCRDPDDEKFLECAVRGKADLLITRDKDLLTLNGFRGIQIVKPGQLSKRLE